MSVYDYKEGIQDGLETAYQKSIDAVETEPELGPPDAETPKGLNTLTPHEFTELVQAAVRVTKRNIAQRIKLLAALRR